jgi:hypothetical protein
VASELIEAFWAESTPYERRLFLDEAAGRSTGGVTFGFDVFDVTLDFDAAKVIVADVLSDDESEVGDLAAFLLRAQSFADDPAIGDGLTEMQRRPPRFAVGADGKAQPLDDGSA